MMANLHFAKSLIYYIRKLFAASIVMSSSSIGADVT
jgi:hypothetical protein